MTNAITLDNEYTDVMLRDDILAHTPDYSAWADGPATAYFGFDDETHVCGTAQKMKYHFKLPNTEKDVTYKIEWDEVTTYPDGTSSSSHMEEEVDGTGDPANPVYSSDHEVMPPATQASITAQSVVVGIVPDDGGGAGSGGTGGGVGGVGGCASCTRSGSASLGASFSVSMGRAQLGRSAGRLGFFSNPPTPQLATPALLSYTAPLRGDVEVIAPSGPITQVKAPEALADVVTVSAYKYQINFYLASQVGSKVGSTYQHSGSPFVTWTIENPDGASATNRLRITETRSSDSVNEYVYNATTGAWELTDGNNIRKETVSVAVNGSAATRTYTSVITKPGGADAFKKVLKYQMYSWGEGIVEETLSPDSNPQSIIRTYDATGFGSGAGGSVVPVKSEIRPDGSWDYYDSYDTLGRPTAVYSSLGNLAPPSSPPSSSSCRYTSYDYTTYYISGSGDNGTLDVYSPRRTIEKLLDQEVARSYLVVLSGERRQIRCQTPGAAWNASDNLITITRYFTSGANNGRVSSVLNPDGTMQIYTYDASQAGDRQTNTVKSGMPNSGLTDIIDGTKTVTVIGSVGEVLCRTNMDIASGVALSSENYAYSDELKRSYTVTYLDGTTSTVNYDCCGLDNVTDREGVVAQYSYDTLHRRTGTTRLDITTLDTLDAAGNALQTVRFGTDNSPILLKQAAYDLAGRVLFETNALNGVTSHTETFAGYGRTVSTTYPDNGTRVELYNQDGSLQSVTGTAVFPAYYQYGVDAAGAYAQETKDSPSGSEWTKTYTDMLGRPYKTVYASGAPFSSTYFNAQGQPWKQQDEDGVTRFATYTAKGEKAYTIVATNSATAAISSYPALLSGLAGLLGGTGRITLVTNDVVSDYGTAVRRTRTFVWAGSGNTPTLISTQEASADGLQTWSIVWNNGVAATRHSQTWYDPPNGLRVTASTAPDDSQTVVTNQYGRLISVTQKDSTGGQIGQTVYSCDPHGRQNQATDARNDTTSTVFNNADLPLTVTTPSPDGVQPGQTTTFYYDGNLRTTNTVQPDQASVLASFYPNGLQAQGWGARTYPAGYGYTTQGRMQTMTNWSAFPSGGARVTTWNYDPYRGWLSGKTYGGNTAGPSYGYTAAGRLQSRARARGVNTTYTTNSAGDLAAVAYDDGHTQSLGYGFDRRGRQTTITQGSITTTRAFDDAGNLLRESYSGGPLSGLSVTNGYDQYLRRTSLVLLSAQGAVLASTAYGYEAASRLRTVSSGGISAGYAYLANSPLVGQIGFTNSGTQRMTTTKQHDFLNRLISVSSAPSAASALSFAYGYNLANQRTNTTLGDGSQWTFANDSLGQVISGRKYWPDATPVAGQQFEYAFDDIGNRLSAAFGGNNAGQNLRTSLYTNNSLNQVTSRDVPGFVPMRGSANSNATVSLWADSGAYAQTVRKGEYYSGEVLATNSSGPVWMTITNLAVLQNGTNADIVSSIVGSALVPATPEVFGYDLDGNMTNDGRWGFTWDAENRLTQIESRASVPSAAKRRLNFTYDAQWRRTQKIVYTNDGSGYVAQYTNRFVYDGWNMVAVLDGSNNLLQSFIWGTDLSGTMQGAGGVGGLLAVTDYRSGTVGTYFPAYDGNGNVVVLVNATDGGIAAQYEYGPFGEVIRATGPMAKTNPFRFSTKYQDDETDLLYYGYRYLSTSSGRWLSRDPLGEKWGGKNLYAALSNDPLSKTDSLGLLIIGNPAFCYECRCKKVNLGPVGPVEAFSDDGIKTPNVSIGPAIPRSFDTEGMLAPHLCKCKYRDSGHSTTIVNGDKRERDFRTFDKPYLEKEIPCTSDVDYPGLKLEGLPPDAPLDIDLTVNMTVTAICDGTDGSHAEASVPVRYHFKQHITGPSK